MTRIEYSNILDACSLDNPYTMIYINITLIPYSFGLDISIVHPYLPLAHCNLFVDVVATPNLVIVTMSKMAGIVIVTQIRFYKANDNEFFSLIYVFEN